MLRVLRELRDGDAEDDEQVDVPLEGEPVIPRAQAFRAGAARGQTILMTILRKRQEGDTAAASQSLQQPPPGPDTSGSPGDDPNQPERAVLFVRDMMVKLPVRRTSTATAQDLPVGGLAAHFLQVAAAADQAEQQEARGEPDSTRRGRDQTSR